MKLFDTNMYDLNVNAVNFVDFLWSIAGHIHIHALERMNITFLPDPRTHRLMKRNGCGVGVLPLWHIIQMS